jgi:hypothetical protein
MHRPVKYIEKGLSKVAGTMYRTIRYMDDKKAPNPSFTPKWTDKRMMKSWERTKPPLGWPRQTDSLCPKCVIEARERILNGAVDT